MTWYCASCGTTVTYAGEHAGNPGARKCPRCDKWMERPAHGLTETAPDLEDLTMTTFRQELEGLINSRSLENVSDTPDYILASFLAKCLEAFDGCTVERDRWHGFRDGTPGNASPLRKWQETVKAADEGDDDGR